CASILYRQKTAESVAQAAEALRLTAKDLHALGVIDEIVPEPLGGAHRHALEAMESLRAALARNLQELSKVPRDRLREARYEKFRRIGVLSAPPAPDGAAASR